MTRKEKRELYQAVVDARNEIENNLIKDIRVAKTLKIAKDIFSSGLTQLIEKIEDDKKEVIRLRKL